MDDAAFEVHYRQGIKQLPSFALADDGQADVVTAVSETESAIVFMVDGLTALVETPVRVSFLRGANRWLPRARLFRLRHRARFSLPT